MIDELEGELFEQSIGLPDSYRLQVSLGLVHDLLPFSLLVFVGAS